MSTAKNLSQAERVNLLHFLLTRLEEDTLARGALTKAHLHFEIQKLPFLYYGKSGLAGKQSC